MLFQVSVNTVLNQDAYLLFYRKDNKYCPPEGKGPPGTLAKEKGAILILKLGLSELV